MPPKQAITNSTGIYLTDIPEQCSALECSLIEHNSTPAFFFKGFQQICLATFLIQESFINISNFSLRAYNIKTPKINLFYF